MDFKSNAFGAVSPPGGECFGREAEEGAGAGTTRGSPRETEAERERDDQTETSQKH